MKQVVQARRNGLTAVREVPLPRCPPGGVLVQNAFSAISSGTERARVKLSQKSLIGKARERPDLVREVFSRARRDGTAATLRSVQRRLDEETPVGYSSAGTIIEVGEHARGLQPGDLVACAGATANHAQFVAVPANLCVRVPEGVPLASAALTTIAAIALHGIRLADAGLGSRVGVIGCGLVGQFALRLLRAAGAETFALDIDPGRVAQARASGANHALLIDDATAEQISGLTGGLGVDQVLVTAAARTNQPLHLAAGIARDRGAVVLVGAVPIEFSRAPLYEKELSFRVSRSYGPGRYDPEYEERGLDYPIGYVRWTEARNMEAVLRLQAQDQVSFSDLVEVVPVERAADAYTRLTTATGSQLRAIVLAYPNGDIERARAGPDHAGGNGSAADRADGSTVTRPPLATGAPVRVGLIGPGSFAGRVLIPALAAAGATLRVVGGGAGPSASAAARAGHVEKVAPDASAVISDPDVDAVVICTRHASHAALAVEALTAGRHVFCEKPLALTLAEHDAVMTAAREAAGILQVGFNRRFSPLLRQMRSFLASARAPMTLVYRVSAGRLGEDHWLHDLAQGGGRALGESCHMVDSISFLADSPIVEVHVAGHGPASRPLQAYDNFVVTLRCADATVASVVYVADGSNRVRKERIEGFCGTRTAILDDFVVLHTFNAASQQRVRLKRQDKGHRSEIDAFLNAARSGRPAVDLLTIDNVTVATLAVVESMRTGDSVRITP